MGDFDPKEFEPLGIILRIPSRKKKPGGSGGGRGRAIQRVQRVVRKAPEVMVKITGRTRGLVHLRKHLNYIMRNGDIPGIGPDGIVFGPDTVNELAKTWWSQREVVAGDRRSNSVESVNMILSMPKTTDRERFAEAAEAFAMKAFGANYDYVLADHRDTDHTHVHLTVRARGRDGSRLNPRKDDLAMWREWMAHELNARGLAAEATPRRARGVVMKSQRQAIRHLFDRGKEDPRVYSRVQRGKVLEAVREANAGEKRQAKPWDLAIAAKQSEIRQAWKDLADQFETEGIEGRAFAGEIRQFVANMPPVKTERDVIRDTVDAELRKRVMDRGEPER